MGNGTATIQAIVAALGMGMAAAIVVNVYIKNVIGRLTRALISRSAKDEETALTLSDIGLDKSFWILFSLRRSSSLRRIVKAVGATEGETVFADTGLYIPEDAQIRAGRLYGRRAVGLFECIFALALTAAIFAVAYYAAPMLAQMLMESLGM